jgi:hypothetical protein
VTDASNDPRLLDLRRMVEAELAMADPYEPDPGEPGSWLVAPTDAEWTAVGLRSLLGAIQAVGDLPPVIPPVDETER